MKMSPSILAATVVVVLCLSEYTSGIRWRVRTFTSNIRHADTDDTVAIRLEGTNGATRAHVLDTARDDFERGAVDTFVINVTENIGTPRSISLLAGGGGDGWHLDKVELELVKEVGYGNWTVWTFNCGFWYDADDLHNIYRAFSSLPVTSTTRWQRWIVYVSTDGRTHAGTDDDVKIKIHGSSGESRLIKLDEPGRDDFRRGVIENFTITTVDLGDPQELTVEAGSGGDGWYLRAMMLQQDDNKFSPYTYTDEFIFKFHRWFDADDPVNAPIVYTKDIPDIQPRSYRLPARDDFRWNNTDTTTG